MKISFHGAAQTVTGSKHLLHLENGKKVLLDCGMFQGLGYETIELNREFGFHAEEVDAVILSHAHIDHCGLLPKLVKDGYLKNIYCTDPTKDLATILMEDSAGIQESDAAFLNKRLARQGKPPVQPLYNTDDAMAASALLTPMNYHEWFEVVEGLECMFTDAGHILGSACVHLRIHEKDREIALSFSGDVGRYRDVILRNPEQIPQADIILLESTYGNSLHQERSASADELLKWITDTCLRKKGKLIIPAFSVGRTQELLFFLNRLELERQLPPIEYFVDSPMSYEVTQVVKNHPEVFNDNVKELMQKDHDPFQFKGLKFIKSVEESKALNFKKEPCVIISASGMAEAGRVKHHISNNIENSRNTILLVGYAEPNSLAGRLKKHPEEVGIFGIKHEVHAQIGEMHSLSAHGDYDDLLQWLEGQDKKRLQQIFLVHGEPDVQEAFANRLRNKGYKHIAIPERHSEYII